MPRNRRRTLRPPRSPRFPPHPRSRPPRTALTGIFAVGTGIALIGTLTLGTSAQAAPPSPPGSAAVAAGGADVTAAGVSEHSVTMAGIQPDWARAEAATGVPSASAQLTTRVFLAGSNPAALAAYATAVSTPGDASYRRFLSPSAAAARFAPSAAEESKVASWLSSAGLHVDSVTSQYVQVSGTTAAMDRAYGVTLREYGATANGATAGGATAGGATANGATANGPTSNGAAANSVAIAPDRDPVVPAALASSISTITGLSSNSLPMYAQHVTAAAAAQDLRGLDGSAATPSGPLIPSPCSAYYGQESDTHDPAYSGVREPYAVCGYSAKQLRSAYGAVSHTGHGATVAILDAYNSPTMLSDADTWSAANGLPKFWSGQYTAHVTPSQWTNQDACGGEAGWAAEQSLDVEAVHAMAPSAHVLYYGANSCQDSDMLAALSDLITHRLADVISDSWGGPLHSTSGSESASAVAEYDHLFELAAIEGITVNFSSGDCGANDPSTGCGGSAGEASSYPQATFPAADPWVTAVGGTSTAIDKKGDLDWATSWGTQAWLLNSGGTTWQPLGWIFGAGGGASADFAQPQYQQYDVPSSLAGTLMTGAQASSPRRVVPDVALDADPFTGMLVGATQQLPDGQTGYAEAAIGGTSLASPLLAGLEADTITMRGGLPLGFINPTLYCLASDDHGLDGAALRDVTDTPSGVTNPIAEVFPPFEGQAAAVAGIGSDGALHAAAGYDDATGLGSPGRWFVDDLAAE